MTGDSAQKLVHTDAGMEFGWHKIGGSEPNGDPAAIGPWTFETSTVRSIVEKYLEGQVLNACAGVTRLPYPREDVHRNDIDPERDADTHFDVECIDDRLPNNHFDAVIFDPPWDQEQADEHYNGHNVGRGPSGGIWDAREALANVTAPGGCVISLGWNSVGLESFRGWEREAIHLFQRASQLPDVVLVVDRNSQYTLTGEASAHV
jgi:hypothetical protein